jgi:hypothetical protein
MPEYEGQPQIYGKYSCVPLKIFLGMTDRPHYYSVYLSNVVLCLLTDV